MMRKYYLSILFLGLAAGSLHSEPSKLGSIAAIEAALPADPSSKTLSRGNLVYVAEGIRKAFAASRYDEYAIPEKLSERFLRASESMPRLMVEDLEKLSTQELVPSMIGLVEAGGKEAKEELLRKVRRRLFVMEKAKELGISPSDLEGLLASKLILVPFVTEFASFRTGQDKSSCVVTMECQVGLLLYEIVGNETGRYAASLRVKAMAKGIGMANCSEKDRSKSRSSAEFVAFRRMVDNGVSNLLEASKQTADPYVLSPMRKWEGNHVWFDGGKDNGVRIDDKRLLIKQDQDLDGALRRRVKGWMVVTQPGKSGIEAQTKAALIAGKPKEDQLLGIYPRWPIEFTFGFRTFSLEGSGRSGLDSLRLSPRANGGRSALLFNAGRYIGIHQLFFGAAYSAGLGQAEGSQNGWGPFGTGKSDRYIVHAVDFPVVKRFFHRRFIGEVSAAYFLQQVRVGLSETHIIKTNSAKGFMVSAGPGLALTPSLTLMARYSHALAEESQAWTYYESGEKVSPTQDRSELVFPVHHEGPSFQVELAWSLPRLFGE